MSICIPSTTSTVVEIPLDSSTVITPSLPTFETASAKILPISGSLFAEMVATFVISSFVSTGLLFATSFSITAFVAESIPRLSSIGFIPEATAFIPSFTIA